MMALSLRQLRSGALLLVAALLTACASGPMATQASPADAASVTTVTELTDADIQRPGKQLLVGKVLKGVALQPFMSHDHAFESVRKQAAKLRADGIIITWSGQRQEDNGGIGGVYFVVEALAVKWVDFTTTTAQGVMGSLGERYPAEVESMLANVRVIRSPELTRSLLATVKMSPSMKYLPALTEAYASLSGPSAAPELVKLLKFHASESVRIEAGRQLLRLGQRSEVEAAAGRIARRVCRRSCGKCC